MNVLLIRKAVLVTLNGNVVSYDNSSYKVYIDLDLLRCQVGALSELVYVLINDIE